MFTLNDDLSIYATRGDIVFFSVGAKDDITGENHKFEAGDILRFKVYGKKDAATVVLQKDFPVAEPTESVEIWLTEEDTRIGGVISKPVDYWYEVELNPLTDPQTIIGYDEDGAKVFKLFPDGDNIPEWTPEPEDIPVVDEELDMTSTRPVQNQAIARAITRLQAQVYPVGSVYMSVNATSPADLFGGTWERLKDRFLLGAGDTYKPGETGGEAEHKLELWEMPVHDHSVYDQSMSSGVNLGVEWGQFVSESSSEKSYGITINGTMKTTESGSSEPHNNMPPYLAVYMWVRVA